MLDLFGLSRPVCRLEHGFTLEGRQNLFSGQLIGLQALSMNVFGDPHYTEVGGIFDVSTDQCITELFHAGFKAGIGKSRIPKGLLNELLEYRDKALAQDDWMKGQQD